MLIVRLLIGRDRHDLQAQFPASTIELWRCHQLGLRSLYSASVAAAATNLTATPTLALMPKTRRKHSSLGFQKSVCLHAIYQALEDRHFTADALSGVHSTTIRRRAFSETGPALLFRCDRRKPLHQRFEARILERETKILEGQYRDRPST
jgi:hypothetical protein